MKNQTKKVYSAPQLTVHGDAAQLTQQTTTGNRFDRQFGAPVVQPILFFS